MVNKTDWKNLDREQRGKLIFEELPITKIPQGWRVRSQSRFNKDYIVKYSKEDIKCNCPDCEITKKKCKHIYAVEYYIKKQIDEEGKVTTTKGIRVTYGQKWSAYDKSQTSEKLVFMKPLRELCSYIEQPVYKFGRPKLPMQDLIFSSAMKIYTTFSLRRFMSDLQIAKEMGLVDYVPCFASVGHFLQREDITPILKDMIKLSAMPLSSVETQFAIDSSGFSVSRFARYFSTRWGKDGTKRLWIKAHIICGVNTNIIVNCEITDGLANDSPQLTPLLEGVNTERWDIKEVSCDRAYSSRNNLELINDMGAIPYIPFRSNAIQRKGVTVWSRMYHYFMYKHDEFMQHYHKRSNVETVFHMIKTKFRDNLRSKTETAMINELLLKILCHNICVVIQEMNELGVRGEFVVEEKIN